MDYRWKGVSVMGKGSIPRPVDKEKFDKNYENIYRKDLTKNVTLCNNMDNNVTNCNKEVDNGT